MAANPENYPRAIGRGAENVCPTPGPPAAGLRPASGPCPRSIPQTPTWIWPRFTFLDIPTTEIFRIPGGPIPATTQRSSDAPRKPLRQQARACLQNDPPTGNRISWSLGGINAFADLHGRRVSAENRNSQRLKETRLRGSTKDSWTMCLSDSGFQSATELPVVDLCSIHAAIQSFASKPILLRSLAIPCSDTFHHHSCSAWCVNFWGFSGCGGPAHSQGFLIKKHADWRLPTPTQSCRQRIGKLD